MSTVVAPRPRDSSAIRAHIRSLTRDAERLEQALAGSLPRQDRKHLQLRLHGLRMSRQSWIDYLEKGKG